MSEDMKRKLASRKLWMAIAAFLASLGAGIAGVVTDNQVIGAVGITCTLLSAAIYAAAEAYVDGASVTANATMTQTVKTVTATATDKATVQAVMNAE